MCKHLTNRVHVAKPPHRLPLRARAISLFSLSLSKLKPQPTNPPAKPYLSSTRRPSAPRRWAGGGRRDGCLLQGVPTRPPLLPSAAASASRGRSNRRRSRGSASRRLAPAAASALGCECPRLSVPLHRCSLEEKSSRDRVDWVRVCKRGLLSVSF